MKKSYTLIELIFVIVIIGILVAIILPRTNSNKLHEAAIQLVSHIRYTQHLAMVDDKFDIDDDEWYKSRWQIRFTDGTVASYDKVAYAIFSDYVGTHSGHPETQELARDPQSNQYITGGITNGVQYDDDNVFHPANLGLRYGIENISLSSSCKYYGSLRIVYDNLGRPIKGNLASDSFNSAYVASNRMISTRCEITLSSKNSDTVVIVIEPETGYSYIL